VNDKRRIFEFGGFVLDVHGRRLIKVASGEPIALTAKVFDTLLHLIEHRGAVQSKEMLLRAIWPELVVEENNLTQNISTLRQALGETPSENKYIATVARRGYQFVAAVTERAGAALPAAPAASPSVAPPPSSTAVPVGTPARPVPPVVRYRRSIWLGTAALAMLLSAGAFLVPRHGAGANPLSSVVGGTRDSAAYLLYSNGRFALGQLNEPSMKQAIGYFEQAIASDPQFALAHARLAECYVNMGIFGMRSPAETFPRARDSVLQALQIEPRLAVAYASLGHIKLQYDRDWDGAEADFNRAIELDPALPESYLYRGALFSMRGDLERSLEDMKKAQQLEPLLTLYKTRRGSMLYFARRYPEAEREFVESLALDDRPAIAHRALGRVYLHTGRYELAFAEFAKCKGGPTPGSYADLAQTLVLSGRRAEAQAELDRVLELSTTRYVSPLDIASIYAAFGDKDSAVNWLELALDKRASALGFVPQNPNFDSLHSDARFVVLVKRIGVLKRPLTP
jgi:DNA-binding winged helix-turn-helix (wHTH) protein/Tfp pilus assembly protein PilF